jgi:hypothetical protein
LSEQTNKNEEKLKKKKLGPTNDSQEVSIGKAEMAMGKTTPHQVEIFRLEGNTSSQQQHLAS